MTGRAEISWAAGQLNNTVPIPDILVDLRRITTVADAVLDSATFHVRIVINQQGRPVDLLLKFEKGNVHPQIFRKLTDSPPGMPLGDTYNILVSFKNSLRNLPRDSRRHWKPGYLILTEILYHHDYMHDHDLIWSIIQQRFPGAIPVTNIITNWNLRDMLSLLAFRPAPHIAPQTIGP